MLPQIKDVMTRQVSVIPPDMSVQEIARKMRDEDIGAIPVAENDKLIGMVTDRDIVIRALADNADARTVIARDIMSPRILYCTEDQTVDEVLKNMGEQQIRRLPVVNRDKRLVGVVSLGDLSQTEVKRVGGALKNISQPVHH